MLQTNNSFNYVYNYSLIGNNRHHQSKGMKIQVGLEFSHLRNFTSRLIYLRIKDVNLCSNDTMGLRNIL